MPPIVTNIIVHCSATPPSKDIDAATIDQWHRAKGWSAIGYHYVIKRDGQVEEGRDLDGDGNILEEVGAHAYGYNQNSVGICLVGGVTEDGVTPDANFTLEQYTSLKKLIAVIREIFPNVDVIGHRDVSDKACPSFNVQALLGEG